MPDAPCLQPLKALLEQQDHRTQILWALDCAAPRLAFFEERRPGEARPRQALELARAWARGQIKMPEAKRAIHAAHNAAAEAGDADTAAAAVMAAGRAVAQAASSVHIGAHALGLVYYGLTSIHYAAAPQDVEAAVQQELDTLYQRLQYWQQAAAKDPGPWAAFLQGK